MEKHNADCTNKSQNVPRVRAKFLYHIVNILIQLVCMLPAHQLEQCRQDRSSLEVASEYNRIVTQPKRRYHDIDANNTVVETGGGIIEVTNGFSWPSEASRYIAMGQKALVETIQGEDTEEPTILRMNMSLSATLWDKTSPPRYKCWSPKCKHCTGKYFITFPASPSVPG
ncbi:hypothetical protein GGR58DRAFT_524231 [Xylaria digitata]|nr:hypothetical protein GGR58DRAFT_524231 [Xylaria digitata]